jgi:O-antigen/teichoic acid export membrane protein
LQWRNFDRSFRRCGKRLGLRRYDVGLYQSAKGRVLTTGRRIFSNAVALGAAQAVTMVTGVITAVILARVLGPASYGVIGFGVAVISYFGLAVNMGMDIHAVREIAKTPSQGLSIVKLVMSVRVILALIFVMIVFIGSHYFGFSEQVRTVLQIQCLGLFGAALTLDFYYQAEQRMRVAALRQAGAAVVGVIAVVLWVRDAGDIYFAAGVPIAVHILSALILCGFFLKTLRLMSDGQTRVARSSFIKRSLPLVLIGILSTIYINLDIVILGFLVDEADVGFYVAATRVLAVAVIMPYLLSSVFFPALSKAFGDQKAEADVAESFARMLGFLGGAIGGVGMILAPTLMLILFGQAYSGASLALGILMVHVIFVHFTITYGTPIVAWQCDKVYTLILVIGAVLNIVLNFVLIPEYGIEGAAWATLITQMTVWLGVMILARKAFNLRHLNIQLRALGVTLVSALPVYLLWQSEADLDWTTSLMAAVGYLVSYVLLSQLVGVIDLRKARSLLPSASEVSA